MITAIYSTKDFERAALVQAAQKQGLTLRLLDESLNAETVLLSKGCGAISIFAGDDASEAVIEALSAQGTKYIAVRAAGYDNVALDKARHLGMKVANVPAYSPYAIAEHAVALILALNRKLVLADRQVHEFNFTVGKLIGFDLHDKTIGIIGTGKIGSVLARILHGFGCNLLAYDLVPNEQLSRDCGVEYTSLEELCSQSDVVTINTCLTPQTKYLIKEDTIGLMKKGVMLINTSRGAIVKTVDLLEALKSGQIGSYGADVYEHEKGLFFYDHSADITRDPLLQQLLALPQVLITPHQAFATVEALKNIVDTTFESLVSWQRGARSAFEL